MERRTCPSRALVLALAALLVTLARTAEAQPVTTDLFDLSQGASVLTHSGMISGSNPGDMFGQTLTSIFVEVGNTLFRDDKPAGFVHSIEWQTAGPVRLDSFNL